MIFKHSSNSLSSMLYQCRSTSYSFQLTRYCSRLSRSQCLKFSMFFIFHSSSSSITTESDDLFRCSFREFFESSCSRFDANFEHIFIVNDSFSQYACSISIRILKSSSILLSSFFDDREIVMFLEFRNIMSFILQIIFFRCLSIYFFIVILTLVKTCLINASDCFMCLNIFFALSASILARVILYSIEFESKLIRE